MPGTPAHEAAGDDAPAEDEEGGSRCALEADLPNLPNVMQRAGYHIGFVGKYHLEPEKYGRYPGKDGPQEVELLAPGDEVSLRVLEREDFLSLVSAGPGLAPRLLDLHRGVGAHRQRGRTEAPHRKGVSAM